MLFMNVTKKIQRKLVSVGGSSFEASYILLGMSRKKCNSIELPVPKGIVKIVPEFRNDLTIGFNRSKNPQIMNKEDDNLYLILSSKGGNSLGGAGYIMVPKNQDVNLIGKANGTHGKTGDPGWDEVIVRAELDQVFCVVWSGGKQTDYYIIGLCEETGSLIVSAIDGDKLWGEFSKFNNDYYLDRSNWKKI